MQERKTKIVATLGPSSNTEAKIKKLIAAGLDVARFNFSHGTHEDHAALLSTLRAADIERHVAVLQDLSGPKIRTGELSTETVTLVDGTDITLTTESMVGDAACMSISYALLPKEVEVGHRILLNDGSIVLTVTKKNDTAVICTVVHGGTIKARRGVNLPDSALSLPSLTDKDIADVQFGIKNNVEFVALSFVQTADDIRRLRTILDDAGSHAHIIAKIETPRAVEDLDSILEVADGIMVARGDLAVEIGPERVPLIQKRIVRKAIQAAKPVIVATQMLESMIENATPTRAEVSDVANAILDGTDAVMLSAETATGKHPVEAIETLARVAEDIEAHLAREKNRHPDELIHTVSDDTLIEVAVAHHAATIATNVNARTVVVFTEFGTTARLVSRFKPNQPIVALSPHTETVRQLVLSYGVYPAYWGELTSTSSMLDVAREVARTHGATDGDKIVVVTGSVFRAPGGTNTLTVVNV